MKDKDFIRIQNILLERIEEIHNKDVNEEYLKENNSIVSNANAIVKASIYMLNKKQFEKKYETE